ncbi:Rv2231c family pyridoxal phosphate-dependent protein CobC [soil metagenome]
MTEQQAPRPRSHAAPSADLLDLSGHAPALSPPAWLLGRLERSLHRLGAPPDPRAAVRAVARRHGRDEAEVLLTAGASEALVLLARALRPERAVLVHPALPTAEDALRGAGRAPERLVLDPPYALDPEQVPADADLVVVANPGDPTGVVHDGLDRLCRQGRHVVVDESLADAVPGEPASLAGRLDLPGLVVVRSLSRTWSLAGLRVGYLLGPAELVEALGVVQAPQPVSTLGLTALETCLARGPVAMAAKDAAALALERERLADALRELGVEVAPESQAPFLLCRVPGRPDLPDGLRGSGIEVRRLADVPGLGPEHWRAAVRGGQESAQLLSAVRDALVRPGPG